MYQKEPLGESMETPQEMSDGIYIAFDRGCQICRQGYKLILDEASWDALNTHEPTALFLGAYYYNICPTCWGGKDGRDEEQDS